MRVRTPVLKLFGALFSVVSLWLAAPACSGASSTTNCVADQSTPLPAYAVTVSIKDESGSTVPNATVTMGDLKWTDASGNIAVTNLSGASLLFVSAPGFLEESVIVARRDAGTTQSVGLLSDKGGTRWTMHSVGDVMLGRRYEVPTSGAPLIPIDGQEKGSRAVVARGQALAAAPKGVMYAVRLNPADALQLLPEAFLSAENEDGGSVVAVAEVNAEGLESKCKDAKVRFVRLGSNYPFHSPLLKECAKSFAESLPKFSIGTPTARVVSTVRLRIQRNQLKSKR